MKKPTFLVFVLLIAFQLNAQIIDERTGIEIHFTVDNNTFPDFWKTEDINAKGVDLDSSELKRSQEVIYKALCKYPKDVLQKNITKIYFLKYIEFFGQGFGGTNSTDVVYIANDGVAKGYTNLYLEKSFHHEFSSILLRNFGYMMDEEAWTKINTIAYGAGGAEALRESNDSQVFNHQLHEKGFLFEYAVSSFENDINSFAENLFLPEEEFYEITENYDKIRAKYLKLVQFYSWLDDTFSENYFRNFKRN